MHWTSCLLAYLGVGFLSISSPLAAQELIPLKAATALQLDQSREQVLLYASLPGGREAVISCLRPTSVESAHGTVAARLSILNTGKLLKQITLPEMFRDPIGRFGTLAFFISRVDNKTVSRTLDLESGSVAYAYEDFSPLAVTSQGKHLAVVGRNKVGKLELRVMDGASPSRPRIFDVPAGIEVVPFKHILSFASANTLLLIDQLEASYVPLHIGKQLAAASKIVLRGPELEQSRLWIANRNAKIQATTSAPNPMGAPTKACRAGVNRNPKAGKQQFVLAHITSRSGRNLFFLGPYRGQDGFRLVEFAEDGSQVRSYRLQVPDGADPKRSLAIQPSALCTTIGDLVLMAPDGRARHYGRP